MNEEGYVQVNPLTDLDEEMARHGWQVTDVTAKLEINGVSRPATKVYSQMEGALGMQDPGHCGCVYNGVECVWPATQEDPLCDFCREHHR